MKENFTEEQRQFVLELMNKGIAADQKTAEHSNCALAFREYGLRGVNFRVDDPKLLFIGCRLIPNVANYLVNILPQLIYPYIVAYLQDLSDEENMITINDLYDLIVELDSEE